MGRIGVSEAAERLGVVSQRVRQRIQDGSLPAERVGRQWVIDERDLLRVVGSSAPGRPLSERSAWALVAAADNHFDLLPSCGPSDRSRARSRLRKLVSSQHESHQGLRLLSVSMRNRADRRCYLIAGRDLVDLRHDDRIRLSGLSNPESGLASGDVVEAYVGADEVDRLQDDYLLREIGPNRANVYIHSVSPDLRGVLSRLGPAAHRLLLAADLAEHDGPREHHRALELLADLALYPHVRSQQARPRDAKGLS